MSSCSAPASSASRRPMPRDSGECRSMLVDRREPGSETSYGNAGIISSGSIFPLNQPSLFGNLPKYLSNRHAALRWDVGWALKNPGLDRAVPGECAGLADQAARAGLAWPDQGVAEAASRMDRAGGRGQPHPRDRLAEGLAQRQCRRREGRSGGAHRIRHQERAVRPPGDLRARAEHPARLQRRPPAHRDRVGGFAGQCHQGLRADACRRRR